MHLRVYWAGISFYCWEHQSHLAWYPGTGNPWFSDDHQLGANIFKCVREHSVLCGDYR